MGKYNESKGACSCVWNTCCLIVYHNVCCADRDSKRPLSQPFPLPQNFSADVEADLKKGSTSVTTMANLSLLLHMESLHSNAIHHQLTLLWSPIEYAPSTFS